MTNKLLIRPNKQSTGRQQRAPRIPGARHHRRLRHPGTRPAGRAHPGRHERVLRGRRLLGSADRNRPASRRSAPTPRASRRTTVLVQGRAAVRRAVGILWPESARWRATTARRRCLACTAARTDSARPGRCRSASKAPPATPGAARNPIRPARWSAGVATDEDGDGIANVYDPADAIAGAAKYLLQADVQANPSAAIFAYNHLQSYVQSVLMYAGRYAGGNFSVVSAQLQAANAAGCVQTAGGVPAVRAPHQAVAAAISFAEQQQGEPTCGVAPVPTRSTAPGLVMMAYRAAGISIARTFKAQWATETRVPASGTARGPGVLRRLGRHRHRPGARRPGDRRRQDDRGVQRVPDPRLQLRQPRRDRLHRPWAGAHRHHP